MAGSRRIAVVLVLLLVSNGCAPSQSTQPQCHPLNAAITKEKDSALPSLLSHGVVNKIDAIMIETMASTTGATVPGCGLAITRDDKIALLRTYGHAQLEPNQKAFDLDTLTAIGSISKTYTALAIIKLLEEGAISSLLAPAIHYLNDDGAPPWSGALIQDLMSHTAGLSTFPEWDLFDNLTSIQLTYPAIEYPSLKPRLVLQGFMHDPDNVLGPPAKGAPAQPVYSNTGYAVLGAIVDELAVELYGKANDRGYEHYIWREIGRGSSSVEPASPALCLGASFREQDVPTLATGYAPNGDEDSFSDDLQHGWGWAGPAGGWWATIGDLARLMLSLQNDIIVSESAITNIMRRDFGPLQPSLGNASMRVGIGLELSPLASPTKWYGKGGHIAGYSSHFRIWPSVQNGEDHDWGIAIACNRSGIGGESLDEIYAEIRTADDVLFAPPDPHVEAIRKALDPFLSSEGLVDEASIVLLVERISSTHEGRLLLQTISQHDWAQAKRIVTAYLDSQQSADGWK